MEKALDLNLYGVTELSSFEAGEIVGGRSVGYVIGYAIGLVAKGFLIALGGSLLKKK